MDSACRVGLAVSALVGAVLSWRALMRPTKSHKALKFLVLHGLSLDTRGKENVAKFGTRSMADYNADIAAWAASRGVTVDTFHTNDPAVMNAKLLGASAGYAGVVINPGGFCRTDDLTAAVTDVVSAGLQVIEVHYTNASRGGMSTLSPACSGLVYGFEVRSYLLALEGLLASTAP